MQVAVDRRLLPATDRRPSRNTHAKLQLNLDDDLTGPWPWLDGEADVIRAWGVIEQLPNMVHTMNDLWRVLCPGGQADISVLTDGSWNRRSFLYYQHGNPYRERFAERYGIRAKFRIVSEKRSRGRRIVRHCTWCWRQ